MKACLALLFLLLPVAASHATENAASSEDQTAPADHQPSQPISAAALAAQVGDIASSPTLSFKEKAEQISTAVRNAVSGATAQLKDPAEVLKIALKFATIAAQAAPQFTDAITNAVLTIPAIATIDGAAAQIQAAVVDAATKAAEAEFASNKPKAPKDPEFGGHTDDTVVSRYR
jgi:hypothetical protein